MTTGKAAIAARTALLSLAAMLAVAAFSPVYAETESSAFADGYIEFLAEYADAGSDEEVQMLRDQLNTMSTEDQWLQQGVEALQAAVNKLEKDPKASAASVLQSVLYVTKGLSDQDTDDKGFTHRLTKEERTAFLARLGAMRDTEWIRKNETVMTAAGHFADFLKRENA